MNEDNHSHSIKRDPNNGSLYITLNGKEVSNTIINTFNNDVGAYHKLVQELKEEERLNDKSSTTYSTFFQSKPALLVLTHRREKDDK